MKTPRELILERHRAAAPRLDEIRAGVLASGAAPQKPACDDRAPHWISVFWREVVFPARWAWSSMAAGWVMILILQGLSRVDIPAPAASVARTSPEVLALLQEQRLLKLELLDNVGATSAHADAPPQPRSGAVPPYGTVRVPRRAPTDCVV